MSPTRLPDGLTILADDDVLPRYDDVATSTTATLLEPIKVMLDLPAETHLKLRSTQELRTLLEQATKGASAGVDITALSAPLRRFAGVEATTARAT